MKMTTRSLVNGVAVGSVATLAFAFGAVDRAQAASIFTGNSGNTGVGAYTVDNGGSTAIVPDGTIGPWVQNSPTSSWIGSTSAAPGTYTYSTNFTLASLEAGTATISGNWAVDDSAVSILLNGSSTGITYDPNTNFAGFSAFSIANNASFIDGINTLAFTINNGTGGNNPSGLNVAMSGTYAEATTAVPEPSDFVGTVFALGSVVALKRKFGKK
jgi:hypothetical protein